MRFLCKSIKSTLSKSMLAYTLAALTIHKQTSNVNPPTPSGVLWRVRATSGFPTLPSPPAAGNPKNHSLRGGRGMGGCTKVAGPARGAGAPPAASKTHSFCPSLYRSPSGPISNGFWIDFPTQVASQNLPKSTKIRCQEALHLGLQILLHFEQIFLRICNRPKAWKGPLVLQI